MAGESIEPRNLLAEPSSFGVDLNAPWLDWDPAIADKVAAAFFQHRFMFAAKIRLASHRTYKGSIKAFARDLGRNYTSVTRLINGARFMTLEDSLAWPRRLSSTIFPTYSSRHSFLPTKLTVSAIAEANQSGGVSRARQ